MKILMCPPDFYEVAYEINPWMSVKHEVNIGAAKEQWQAYYDLLTEQLKASVELLKPVKGLPDMVFTANAGVIKKRTFVRSNFRFSERKGEEPYFDKWFKKQGYLLKTIERPLCFEGEGDALPMAGEYYMGYHFRSDVEALDRVAGFLKTPYYALELCDKRFYHLDTCFAPLNDKSALAFMPAFDSCAQLSLLETIEDIIKVPEDEALRFSCNAAVVGTSVVIPTGCPKTEAELAKRGFKVYALDFSEFIKAGGAAKCLMLKL